MKHLNKIIITICVILFLLSIRNLEHAWSVKNSKEKSLAYTKCDDDSENILNIFISLLIEKKTTKKELISLFTVEELRLIEKTTTSDFFWEMLDYYEIDKMEIDDNTEIYCLKSYPIFFLIKNDILIDYRYRYKLRNGFFKWYLENKGQII